MKGLLILAMSSALLLSGCGDSGSGGGDPSSTPGQVELTVSAAASLTEAFGEIGVRSRQRTRASR